MAILDRPLHERRQAERVQRLMCGICGIAYHDTAQNVERGLIQAMCRVIRHRGPDDEGYYLSDGVGLGMRRLSIIDVEGGHQPIPNETSTIHTVCNGEIYNFRLLQRELMRTGHSFRTGSDAEVIVHAYEESADAFLRHLRGMFAFAIWDEERRQMVIAVDRFGIKPLYWAEVGPGLVFGSELKCLLASGLITREPDLEALSQYFTLGYIPAPLTIFKSVKKLAPGHFLRWAPGGPPNVGEYWDIPRDSVEYRPSGETRYRLREALRESVQAHLVSDVPLGAFLSGGIDSSAVVALMSEVSGEAVKTFSIGFHDPRYNELDKAQAIARRFRTDHHELIVEPEDATLLTRLVAHFDEPFADSSALPTYYVSKLAREHVKVALSGDGGDELFVGYTIFRGLELARYAQRMPALVRAGVAAWTDAVPRSGSPAWNDRIARWQKRATDTLVPPDEAYRRKIASPGLDAVLPCLAPDLRHSLCEHDPYSIIEAAVGRVASENGHHPLDPYIYAGLRVRLAGDMLVKVDRMSMASSLEVRVPLLDHILMDHVATIPVEHRFRQWRLKGLFKDALTDMLPKEILAQPKRGFNVPLAAWFRGDLERFALEVLTSSSARRRGFLDVGATEKLLMRHASGRKDMSTVIWSLMMFELWCDTYLSV